MVFVWDFKLGLSFLDFILRCAFFVCELFCLTQKANNDDLIFTNRAPPKLISLVSVVVLCLWFDPYYSRSDHICWLQLSRELFYFCTSLTLLLVSNLQYSDNFFQSQLFFCLPQINTYSVVGFKMSRFVVFVLAYDHYV